MALSTLMPIKEKNRVEKMVNPRFFEASQRNPATAMMKTVSSPSIVINSTMVSNSGDAIRWKNSMIANCICALLGLLLSRADRYLLFVAV